MLKIILMSKVGQRLILTKYFLQTIAYVKKVMRWIQDVKEITPEEQQTTIEYTTLEEQQTTIEQTTPEE